MKTQDILILLLLFQVCLTSTLKKYKLEIKNGIKEDDDIVLVPGVFTKISLVLKSLEGDDFTFQEEDKIGFKVSFDDKKIVSFTPGITMIPQENLAYTNYIGISCANQITAETYDIPLKVELLDKTDEGSIEYDEKLTVKVKNVKTDIKLDLLLDSIVQKSQNFFKLENELYNVDEINISLDDKNSFSDKFEFNAISIASFAKRQNNKDIETISKENPANHGILFNSPFFPKDTLESALFNLNLKLDGETNGLCFNLFKSNFNFELKKDGLVELDANVKTAITYNTQDETPKYDVSNKIKINTYIPIAPVILECKFYLDSSLIVEENSLLRETIDEEVFKTVVTSQGKFDITMEHLNASAEYYVQCDISNTGIEGVLSKIKVLIGNFDGSDIIKSLLPSRDPNAIPQCVTFSFENSLQSIAFSKLSPLYCQYFMKKNDSLIVKALPTIICNVVERSGSDCTLCASPSPLYNAGKFISKKETDFNKRFDEFVETIGNFDISEYGLDANILKVTKYVREYDNVSINPNSISVSLTKISSIDLVTPFTFEVKSTHSQNIECYYNKFLTDENSKFLKLFEERIVLAPNQKEEIDVGHATFLVKDDKLYSLNFKCYNLPGFIFKYETTGTMNKFTYYNTKSAIEQITELIEDTTINCNEKKNQLNPRCLKENLVSIIDQIRTEVPQRIKEIENEVQKYASTAKQYKELYLAQLLTEFQSLVISGKQKYKEIVEKGIELLKYLTYTDCSIYASGSTNEESQTIKGAVYLECRKKKQTILEKILTAIKDKIQCPSIVALITQNFISNNLEENVKYILLLINELSNNPEAFNEKTREILLDLVECIQYQFDRYWPLVEDYLRKTKNYLNETITAIKRDIEIVILQTLENLAKVIDFEQLDGYIATAEKEITKTGLIIYDKAREIQRNITEFAKKLNQFGTANYTFSGSMFANIETKEGVNAGAETETKISFVPDKDIVVITNSNFLLNKNGAYALQTLVFESPLVSVKAKAEAEGSCDTVNTFISITLYDSNGKEISIKDLAERFRPQILYLKEKYNQLKACYYYDEKRNELVTSGLTAENVTFMGKEYFKCSSSHLTSFTAGTYGVIDNRNSEGNGSSGEGSNTTLVVLVILGIILLLVIALILFILIKKRNANKVNNSDIDSIKKDEGLVSLN